MHPDRQALVRGKTGLAHLLSLVISFFKGPFWGIVPDINNVISKKKSLEDLNYVTLTGSFTRLPSLFY